MPHTQRHRRLFCDKEICIEIAKLVLEACGKPGCPKTAAFGGTLWAWSFEERTSSHQLLKLIVQMFRPVMASLGQAGHADVALSGSFALRLA